MGNRRFVNIRIEETRQDIYVEMPGKEQLRELIPDLVKVLNPPQYQGMFEGVEYRLFYGGAVLPEDQNLVDLGIDSSETLILSLVELPSSNGDTEVSDDSNTTGVKTMPFVTAVTSEIPTQHQKLAYHHIPVEEPSLVSISRLGWVFVIGMTPFTIGRPDKDFMPDMDLTEIDTRVRSSRRHAEIIMKKNHLGIVAYDTTNGTFLNGRELQPGKPKMLKKNDKIQFGKLGVKFAFRTPSKQED
jgi:hypothetical protein